MPYTIEDYRRETTRENLAALSEDELSDVLKDLPYEQLLKLVPIDERLKDIPVEQIEAWLKARREGDKPGDGNDSAN